MKNLKYILIGVICVLGITLIVNVYLYWKATVNDNHGYNSINALIALIGLLVNIITIFFLAKTYLSQKGESKDNKQNIEFNRILDIIYQHSTKTIKDIEVFRNKEISIFANNKTTYDKAGLIYIQYVNDIFNQINNNPQIDIYYPRMSTNIIPNYKHLLNSFNTDIKKIVISFNIYNDLIHKNNTLDKNQKNILINIVKDLFYDDFVEKYIPLEVTILQLYNNNIKESMDKYNNIKEIILDIQNLVTAIEQNKIEVNRILKIID